MNRENATKALKERYLYYGYKGRVAFQCDSWLLYPNFENVFVKGGNIMEFRTFFDVISSKDNPTFEDCWRLFKVGRIENLDVLPTNTTLQRNMINHLKTVEKQATGLAFLYLTAKIS